MLTEREEPPLSQSGTAEGYLPEYWNEKEWVTVPTQRGEAGIPYPLYLGGILETLGLFGYEQAQALAYGVAAKAASEGVGLEVRVQSYSLRYDLSARKAFVV